MQVFEKSNNMNLRNCINVILVAVALNMTAVADMARLKEEMAAEQESFLLRHPNSPDRAVLEEILRTLSSEKNPQVGDAIDKLIEIKDIRMLIVSLKYPRSSIRKQVALALNELADESSLPGLVEALDYENSLLPRSVSNSEIEVASKELQMILLGVIRKISGIPYEGPETYSPEAITIYLNKVRALRGTPPESKSHEVQSIPSPPETIKNMHDSSRVRSKNTAATRGDSNSQWLWVLGVIVLILAGWLWVVRRS